MSYWRCMSVRRLIASSDEKASACLSRSPWKQCKHSKLHRYSSCTYSIRILLIPVISRITSASLDQVHNWKADNGAEPRDGITAYQDGCEDVRDVFANWMTES